MRKVVLILRLGFLEAAVIDMPTAAECLRQEDLLLLRGVAWKLEALHEGACGHSGCGGGSHSASFQVKWGCREMR